MLHKFKREIRALISVVAFKDDGSVTHKRRFVFQPRGLKILRKTTGVNNSRQKVLGLHELVE